MVEPDPIPGDHCFVESGGTHCWQKTVYLSPELAIPLKPLVPDSSIKIKHLL
jgi:hypothetical protein